MDLETRLDQFASENQALHNAKLEAEEAVRAADQQRQVDEQVATEALTARDQQVREKDVELAQLKDTLHTLQREIARLTGENENLAVANKNLSSDVNERFATLQAEHAETQQKWQESGRALEELQQKHAHVTGGMETIVRDEISAALEDRNSEIHRLQEELGAAQEQVKTLQRQILAGKQGESFLTVRDEDYFDGACQQLCQHVQQWVLRFSKYSDTRACRLSSELNDDKIEARLDNAILDGTDVDMLLADRQRRRDVFMSIVMTMIWEYVFTRYLFGMDQEQRQKLKSLEKTLSAVGPAKAVAQWRAITLTLLAKRDTFMSQRTQDTEAVIQEIYRVLSALLPPSKQYEAKCLESLRALMRLAVQLSIEMRTQRAEYIMLPPLQPEYDTNGDLAQKVHFNASLMNERSGDTISNADLEERAAVVKIVLFPLVVKKGDDQGEGDEEIVVFPAQVLIAKPRNDKRVVRVMSGAMDIDNPVAPSNRSMASIVPDSIMEDADNVI